MEHLTLASKFYGFIRARAILERHSAGLLSPNDRTIDQVLHDKDLLAGFDDSDVMSAVNDIAKNPKSAELYASNPKVCLLTWMYPQE